MGSDETAITIPGGPWVITFFTGTGRHRVQIIYFFSDADRLAVALWDRSKVGWSPTPHAPVLGALRRALDPKLEGLVLWPDVWLRELPDMYLSMEAPAHAA